MPSISEGFGLTAIEAMVNRSVVIASVAGDLKSVIDHGKNGYRFPVGDYDRMNELLNSLILNYPRLSIDLEQVARDTGARYSIQSQADLILEQLTFSPSF